LKYCLHTMENVGSPLTAREVYTLLKTVRKGQVTTYGDLAKALGHPRAARAVGRIMNANPDPIVVPCHRVVTSNGDIGGYAYGTKLKKDILAGEGLLFEGYRIKDFEKRRAVLKKD
jgi:methylated-DNA-[protein]-cysteine S-methyltransferase